MQQEGMTVTRGQLELLLRQAIESLVERDADLLERNNNERCLTARLAHHLQNLIDDSDQGQAWSVDVEFSRQGAGDDPKLLAELEGCANKFTPAGQARVIPDLIVHQRGPEGPNLLVVEIKITTNEEDRACDRRRVEAFCAFFQYQFGAVIDLETRRHRPRSAMLSWYRDGHWENAVRLPEPS